LQSGYPEEIFFFGARWNKFGQRFSERIHEVIGCPAIKIEIVCREKGFFIENFDDGFDIFQVTGRDDIDNETGAFLVAEGNENPFAHLNIALQIFGTAYVKFFSDGMFRATRIYMIFYYHFYRKKKMAGRFSFLKQKSPEYGAF
jgi:hypothetical protein